MTANEIKDFFNSHFFADGEEQQVRMDLSFKTSDGKICKIPGVEIWQSNTVGQIFHAYHKFVKKNGPQTANKKSNSVKDPEVEKVRTVEYRSNEYIVQYYADGTTTIRKPNGEFLNQASPTARAILKRAKE